MRSNQDTLIQYARDHGYGHHDDLQALPDGSISISSTMYQDGKAVGTDTLITRSIAELRAWLGY